MHSQIDSLISQVSTERLREYVKRIEGLRHGWQNYDTLEKKATFIEEIFRSLTLQVENQAVPFSGRTYRNIVATKEGSEQEKDWVLLGAHYDAAWGSPGADDNASGAAVLLETANILSTQKFKRTIQFAAFTLEEPQPQTIHFLIGSDLFAREAKRSKKRYDAVLILESVGYTDDAEGSQIIPVFVRIPVPRKGNFLGIVANRKSNALMESFRRISTQCVPELPLVSYKVPLSGRLVPETRFSDHASFWNYGYPALMLTDTAMFRNPHYHTYRDRYETLDFSFLSNTTKAVIAVLTELCNEC
jgi:Zn-dependent M28 family amino/carboxypeptidase